MRPLWIAALLAAIPGVAHAQDTTAMQHDQSPTAEGRQYPSLKIAGFGDINFSTTKRPEGARGFNLGQFVLHMTSELSPRVTFFGEISFTARSDAGTGSPSAVGFNTEVERMIVRFDHSDYLKMSLGRYHTPINFWNTEYHHGQWLQTTIQRPEMVQFGGRFLPVHFVGALVEGITPAGGLNLNYQAGVGNGRSSIISRAGDAGDSNGKRAFLATLFVKPDAAYGLRVGGSAYADTITLASGQEFEERIVTAHAAWQKEDPEVIAELASVRHQQAGSSVATWSHAYYVQVAYRLPGRASRWKPYYRFDHVGVNAADAVFTLVPRLDSSTLGVRFDLSLAAVKGEYRTWVRGPGSLRNHGGFFQMCFTF